MKINKQKRKLIFLLSLFVSLFITLHSCMTFRMSHKEINNFFATRNINGSQHQYTTGFRTMHYVKAGVATGPVVLFVHGSPGSLSAFIDFLADSTLTEQALLITADRPGFGYSNFGNAEPSLQKQAEALHPILEEYQHHRPVILVGHSLGGPLIARMAIDYPHLIDGLIIVSGSIDPGLEPDETWFRAPLATPFLRWILPRSFRSSNEELYQLKPQLEAMLPLWKKITCSVIVIHGTKDVLVDSGNADFAEKMLTQASTVSVVRAEGINHFIPWSNPELIREAIIKIIHTSHHVLPTKAE
jgi:pimeloyl-ACP methyl ester carboxylesterase